VCINIYAYSSLKDTYIFYSNNFQLGEKEI
jgi:hypothetical protein